MYEGGSINPLQVFRQKEEVLVLNVVPYELHTLRLTFLSFLEPLQIIIFVDVLKIGVCLSVRAEFLPAEPRFQV